MKNIFKTTLLTAILCTGTLQAHSNHDTEGFDRETFESMKLREMALTEVKINEAELRWECQKNAQFPAQLKNCSK